jgi:hypothetical protein
MAAREMFRGHRITRWSVVLVAIASAGIATIASRSRAGDITPTGCTSIQDIPVNYSIDYGAAIQGLFNDFSNGPTAAACVSCHTTNGGIQGAAGNLDLDASETSSYGNLVNVPSDEDPDIIYVVPNHPEQSLLFQKINCENPAVGGRMPLGYAPGTLTPEQQAAVYDWIAAGAPVVTTDGIFRGNFDIRGFDQ